MSNAAAVAAASTTIKNSGSSLSNIELGITILGLLLLGLAAWVAIRSYKSQKRIDKLWEKYEKRWEAEEPEVM